MSSQSKEPANEGSGKEVGDSGPKGGQKKSIHPHRRNNEKQNNTKSANYLLYPPSSSNPGNIAQWKRRISGELKEKAHRLACFTESGKRYVRPLPELIDKKNAPDDKRKNRDDGMESEDSDSSSEDSNVDSDSDSHDSSSAKYMNRGAVDDNPVDKLMKIDAETRRLLFLEDMKQYRKDVRRDDELYEEMYVFIWNRCSLEAQQLLEQQKKFKKIARNCETIKLWKLIERTFLRMDNFNDKKLAAFSYNRYFNDKLAQNSNESVASFKERFDFAVKALDQHGIAKPPADQLALTFIDKLDERQFASFKKEYMKDLKKGIKSPPEDIQDALDEINKFRYNNPNQGGDSGGYRNTRNQYSKNSAVYTAQATQSNGTGTDNNQKTGGRKQEPICYGCKQKGHIKPNCPNKDKPKSATNYVLKSSFFCLSARVSANNGEDSKVSKHQESSPEMIHTKILVAKSEEPGEILLDSGAQASVVKDRSLLTNVSESDVMLSIEGVNGKEGLAPMTNTVGTLGSFGMVFLCEDIRVNVLSFADVRDRCRLSYIEDQDVFLVTCDDGTQYKFARREKLYATNISLVKMVKAITAPATVRDTEQLYHRHEVKRAKKQ